MKIRQGFVSNSSSSSFIIIDSKDGFEKEHEEMVVDESFTLNELIMMFTEKAIKLECDVKDLKAYVGIDYC